MGWFAIESDTDLEIVFDEDLTPDEVKEFLELLADFYREMGGVGLKLDLEHQLAAEVRARVYV